MKSKNIWFQTIQKALKNNQKSLLNTVWSRSWTVPRRAWKKGPSQNIFKISFHADMVISRMWSCFEFCASLLKWLWSEIETMLRKKYCEMYVKKESLASELVRIQSALCELNFWTIDHVKLSELVSLVAMKSSNVWFQTVQKHSITIIKVCLTQYKADPGPFCEGLGTKKHLRIFSKFHFTLIWSSKEFGLVLNFLRASWNDSDHKLKRCWKKYCEMYVKKEVLVSELVRIQSDLCELNFWTMHHVKISELVSVVAMKSSNIWFQTVQKHSITIRKVCLTQYKADPGPFCEGLGTKKHLRIFSKFHFTLIWSSKEFGLVLNFLRASWNDSDHKLKRCWEKYCEMSVKKKGTSVWTCVDLMSSLWTQFLTDAPRDVIRVVFNASNEICKDIVPNCPKALNNYRKSLLNPV